MTLDSRATLEPPASTTSPDLTLSRLHLMRAGYLLMGVGLALVVALPKALDGSMDADTTETVFSCSLVVLILAVIPWRYVWRTYVRAARRPVGLGDAEPLRQPRPLDKLKLVASHPPAVPYRPLMHDLGPTLRSSWRSSSRCSSSRAWPARRGSPTTGPVRASLPAGALPSGAR